MAIEIIGFDDVFKDLDDMNISDIKKRKALKAGAEVIVKAVEDNSPQRTGKMKGSWKSSIKKFDGNLGFEVRGNTPQDIENEFGSSKNKKHVGFFSRAVDRSADEAVAVIAREVFK